MKAAREAVLDRVRIARRQRGLDDDTGRSVVDQRMARPPANLVPARGDLELEERLEMFRLQAEAVETAVDRIAALDQLPERVAGFLRRNNLPLRLVIADHPMLDGVDFAGSMLEVERGRAARDEDAVGLTVAVAGVAETGTVLVRSSAATPTSLAFLPETAIVLLDSERVLASYEQALRRLLHEDGGALPRSMNFVTGPSRSADIEQTLHLGAHGPRRLLVVLVDSPLRSTRSWQTDGATAG